MLPRENSDDSQRRETPMPADGPTEPWDTPELVALCDAFLSLKTRQEMAAFLRDVCTLGELDALGHRLAVARLLEEGDLSYAEIASELHGSTTTVTRVAYWVRHGQGGYHTVLSRLKAARDRP
jgi:TrpR-related protein YerC/YecD